MERNIIFTQIPLEELKEIISACVRIEVQKSSGLITQPDNELIKVDEAVKLFHVSKTTLSKWRDNGVLPYYRISTRIYFKRSELLDALKASPKYKHYK